MCWTVGISPLGEGPTGRGNSFPLPCLPHSNHLTSRRPPHPARAFGAPPPPPPGGGVRAWRYQGSSRIRDGAGGKPYPALLQDLPVHWTVGISPRGVGLTGRGNLFPLPCLSRSRHLASRCRHFCEGYPYTSPAPHPARASSRGIPVHFCRQPLPSRACGKGYPYASAALPHPRPSLSREGRAISGGQPCGRLLPRLSPRT